MSIITAIFNRLSSDTNLAALLAEDPLQAAPAIYEEWANENTAMPYIVQTHENSAGNHFAKTDSLAIFDIFTDKGTVNAEAIKNRVIKLLDMESVEVENANNARFYYSRDQNIGDPDIKIVHWQLIFDVAYWRKNFITYLNEDHYTPPAAHDLTLEPVTGGYFHVTWQQETIPADYFQWFNIILDDNRTITVNDPEQRSLIIDNVDSTINHYVYIATITTKGTAYSDAAEYTA
jgi:hypothetical protein